MAGRPPTLAVGIIVSTLTLTLLLYLRSMGDTTSKPHRPSDWHFQYDSVRGYFLQDNARTNPGTFDAMRSNFGLIAQEYDTDSLLPANGRDLTQWERFANKVRVLNERAAEGTSFRLLFLGRHGQGYHNVGSAYYGSQAWDCYHSTLREDFQVPSVRFFDAHLTALGKHQAHLVTRFWRRLIETQRIPVPQTYYCSPLARAMQTADLSFTPLSDVLPRSSPFKPLVKELLREGYGIHTCDSRSNRTYIQTHFPQFDIEDSFTETDELYSPIRREPPLHHAHRLTLLLDDVFANDNSTYISMTSHSGTIQATLAAVGHRSFLLPTGGVIPVLVRVRKVSGRRPDGPWKDEQWETKPDCLSDPRKAGLDGYKDISEYVDDIERGVPRDWVDIDELKARA